MKTESVSYICITVCTRQRPTMLTNLIKSYASLKVPNDITISLEVVENACNPINRQLVTSLSETISLPIYYHLEPKQGIPFARNKCLDIARSKNADYIVFVDDDEWFPPNWINEIWGFCKAQPNPTAIQGPVISVLPPETKPYFQDFFQPQTKSTGSHLSTCATNNALVPLNPIIKMNLRFDETYPFAGGTDAKFFKSAKSHGLPLIYCAEAHIYEDIPPERATYKWLSKRYFRIGIRLAEEHCINDKIQLTSFLINSSIIVASRLIKSALYLFIMNKKKHLKHLLKACNRAGQCFGLFGFKIDSYRNVDGF